MVDNYVTLIGNVTRDPELRYTPSGASVANFGIAHNERRRNKDTNEWEDGDTSFFDVTVWQQLAENVAESVQKGTRVIVSGRLQQRSWETDNGDKRSKVEVVADEVGPSLKWATASIQRTESGGNRERSSGGGSRGGNGGGRSSGSGRGGGSFDDAEEPF